MKTKEKIIDHFYRIVTVESPPMFGQEPLYYLYGGEDIVGTISVERNLDGYTFNPTPWKRFPAFILSELAKFIKQTNKKRGNRKCSK